MFPTLPSMAEVCMDRATLGLVGAEMMDRFFQLATELGDEKKAALKAYLIGTAVDDSKVGKIGSAGCADIHTDILSQRHTARVKTTTPRTKTYTIYSPAEGNKQTTPKKPHSSPDKSPQTKH